MSEELERLEKLKEEAIANPPKKKRGCSDCKKKAKQVKQVVLPDPFEAIYQPTPSDIRTAYLSIINLRGINENDKPLVAQVFKALFKEEFDFNCVTCMSKQAMRFYNYCKTHKYI